MDTQIILLPFTLLCFNFTTVTKSISSDLELFSVYNNNRDFFNSYIKFNGMPPQVFKCRKKS